MLAGQIRPNFAQTRCIEDDPGLSTLQMILV